jgi:prefoldin subunit 5
MPDLNPVQIENRILASANTLSKTIEEMDSTLRVFQEAQREYDRARARAFLGAAGSIPERNAQVELAVVGERDTKDVAEAAWAYARNRSRALQSELDALRSVGASVRTAYQEVRA